MFKPVLTTLVAAVLLAGCANQRFSIGTDISNTSSAKSEDSQAFFVDGIGQKTTVNAAQTCGGAEKVAGVAVEQSGLDVLLRVVTFGIYTPHTARVYCK